MLYLEIETRTGTQRIPLVGPRMSIGRLSYNDIVIADSQISRQHAELRHVDGQWWIADLQSMNGIHLRDRRVPVHRLESGDTLVLAPEVRIHVLDDTQAHPPAAPSTSGRGALAGERWGASQAALRLTPAEEPQASPGPAPLAPQLSPPTTRARGQMSEMNATPPPARPPIPNVPASAISSGRAQPGKRPESVSAPRYGNASGQRDSGGPMPSGPFQMGGEGDDPFRRSLADAAMRPNLIPAQSLLHVCQTCGQLTAPDAIYCQSCHQSIAYTCGHCGFSLLPIQDRCPRCQAANPASVRRAHRLPS